MAIDGIFTHYLVAELQQNIKGARINKIYQPHPLDLVFNLRTNTGNCALFLSSSLNAPRIHLTKEKFDNPDKPYTFCTNLRKYVERGYIEDLIQIGNDRLIKIVINTLNELGDEIHLFLFLELMGRNANIILTDENQVIIEAIRHFLPDTSKDNSRIILPKATYKYPNNLGYLNPFSLTNEQVDLNNLNILEGCSKPFIEELQYQGNLQKLLKTSPQPVFYPSAPKMFYVFPFTHLDYPFQTFETISALLDYVYQNDHQKSSVEWSNLSLILKRELHKQHNKLANLEKDRDKALPHLTDKNLGLLIQANLYQIKRGMKEVILQDFYHQNKEITIKLDERLDPSQNMKRYFNLAKKAEGTLKHYEIQKNLTLQEIKYLEGLSSAINFADKIALDQIRQELIKGGYLRISKNDNLKPKKITLLHYALEDGEIWIGKNNIQNDFLTNHFAKSTDYWFHVKDAPGSHVILRTNELTEKLIRLAAQAAALYSKNYQSSSVPVDYTLRKYLKKIPGLKGCEVTYTNQKTIFIDPDEELFQSLLK